MNQRKLPTLAEIHADNDDAIKMDGLKMLLNNPVPAAWIKKHPLTGNPYLPVDKVETLLDKIFIRWKRDIKSVLQVENSVVAVVRLWYWNPTITRPLVDNGKLVYDKDGEIFYIHGDFDFHDGAGAMPLQVDKEYKPSDMEAIKSNAVQLAVGAAASYALKDAADCLGRLFGRDITRKDTVAFDPTFKDHPTETTTQEKKPPPPPPLPKKLEDKVVASPAAAFTADAFAAAGSTKVDPFAGVTIEF